MLSFLSRRFWLWPCGVKLCPRIQVCRYDASARTGFDKLAGRLPAVLREELKAIRDVVSIEAGARHHYQQAPLQTLVEAARKSETVEMHYYTISRDVVTIRKVDPYSLALRQGYMNLVAFCHQRQQVLLFSLITFAACARPGSFLPSYRDFH